MPQVSCSELPETFTGIKVLHFFFSLLKHSIIFSIPFTIHLLTCLPAHPQNPLALLERKKSEVMKLLQLSGAHERDAIYFPIEKYAATWAQDLFRHRETHMGARFYKCPNCGKSSFSINQLHDIDHSKSGYISSSTQRRSGVLIKLHILFRRAKRYLLGVGILKKTWQFSSFSFTVFLEKNIFWLQCWEVSIFETEKEENQGLIALLLIIFQAALTWSGRCPFSEGICLSLYNKTFICHIFPESLLKK